MNPALAGCDTKKSIFKLVLLLMMVLTIPNPGVAALAPQLQIGPIEDLTTHWHRAPEATSIPAESTILFRMRVQEGASILWEGASEISNDGRWSIAEWTAGAASSSRVVAIYVRPDGSRVRQSCQLEPVDILPQEIQVFGLELSVDSISIDPDDVFGSTYHYFSRPNSIAALERVSPSYYRTSTRRLVQGQVQVDPPGFAPLIEWRPPVGAQLGAEASLFWQGGPRVDEISIGPLDNPLAFTLETYSTRITSHVSFETIVPQGEEVTFIAETDPPGYEERITWLASTMFGTCEPILGQGPTFTARFDDTWGRTETDPVFQWLGVRADNVVFNQDQKDLGPGTCQGGSFNGQSCASDADCPDACENGFVPGFQCSSDLECHNACEGGVTPGALCVNDSSCPGACSGGATAGELCNFDDDCADACLGGVLAGSACSTDSDCMGLCIGGTLAGNTCLFDSDCPDACEGGFSPGIQCFGDDGCPNVCVGGPLQGSGCVDDSGCPGSCLGGGESCLANSDCPSVCVGGSDPGMSCTMDSECWNVCVGGSNAGSVCNTDAECGEACFGGADPGMACTDDVQCWNACVGGIRSDMGCSLDTDCPGGCVGGSNDGSPCGSDMDCPDGTCAAPGSCSNTGSCEPGSCSIGTCQGQCDDLGSCNLGTCTDTGMCFGPGTCTDFGTCPTPGSCTNIGSCSNVGTCVFND